MPRSLLSLSCGESVAAAQHRRHAGDGVVGSREKLGCIAITLVELSRSLYPLGFRRTYVLAAHLAKNRLWAMPAGGGSLRTAAYNKLANGRSIEKIGFLVTLRIAQNVRKNRHTTSNLSGRHSIWRFPLASKNCLTECVTLASQSTFLGFVGY